LHFANIFEVISNSRRLLIYAHRGVRVNMGSSQANFKTLEKPLKLEIGGPPTNPPGNFS